MRSRATSSTKPPPTAAPREPARRQSAGMWRRLAEGDRGGFGAQVTLSGSQLRLSCAGNWNSAAVELPMVLPIRILQLSPAAQQLIDNNGTIESVCKCEWRNWIEQMLKPPFRVARNGEDGGSHTACHLQ
jgi:hypothetical protein